MKSIKNLLCLIFAWLNEQTLSQTLPLIVTTWGDVNATLKAWDMLYGEGADVVDSIVGGCSVCEIEKLCSNYIGYGHSPSASGEVTLDAMIMDGRTMEAGSVGCLRRVKNAIGVAQAVMKYTKHTMLVGELATEFALEMGFPEEDLSSNVTADEWTNWKNSDCQPNYWKNVVPDPGSNCGPYTPIANSRTPDDNWVNYGITNIWHEWEEPPHDTIGMVAVDATGNIASGTSTNGARFKIPGCLGDAPIVGSGAYAENGAGAAAMSGDGDFMMRLNPAFHAVMLMDSGSTPQEAAQSAIDRMALYNPDYNGGIITINPNGNFGVACHGFVNFSYNYIHANSGGVVVVNIPCS